MEFYLSRQARDRYTFNQSLFSIDGRVILTNFHAVRVLAQKINLKRDLVNFPEQAVKAGQINAMGLINEILHYVVTLYQQQKNPRVMGQAVEWLEKQVGVDVLDKVIVEFTAEFPPLPVHMREISISEYLNQSTGGVSNRNIALEQLIMLWVANKNPAFAPYVDLFDDSRLVKETPYTLVMQEIYSFFDKQPRFGPEQQNLIDMVRSPAIKSPNSLTGQLEFIRERWADLLGNYLYRLLSSLDLIKEEEKASFFGPGPVPIPVYGTDMLGGLGEVEHFSPDREWMPRLVIIAKNAYVWLDQLSKKYKRNISRLDQIPDEELDTLADWGFTGLWLIGLWERSQASSRIKKLCGNPEAIASAYSLAGYWIAADLGGDEALNNLQWRAWQRGIRLASDMVPNHMGIDSPWVVEHPDWFVSLDYSPFPSYSFNGPDLSQDQRVGMYIEDHYYNRTDAAVVFKRIDHFTGESRYVYHGNDGTSMPWNDTAQLNYLNPQVREAVIQTILSVAKQFPIIRFDAAMTLAKRHFQRLWYPEPGGGGDIPTRAEHGMSKAQFDSLMPVEFWREVVDRAAIEAPDTLLLAEAFWLMEGYFVRTLGMHRVYNSAFMNLLRNEDNAKYRLVMKNTIEFEPEILKRFVNFMNNPDERTAVDQFGKGDKYFGICIMMSTLPGLPMYGHGQIEGFTEKYGMEFRRAYWEEQIDPYLVERHEREVFPLLHKRAIFAGVEHFLLYDFHTDSWEVNEDVFAYSNRLGGERSLIVYHNKFASTHGWLHTSVSFFDKTKADQQLATRTLVEGLNVHPAENRFIIFRDSISGLEFIHSSKEIGEKGLYLELSAYKYYVFLDFQEVNDDEWHSYRRLCDYLHGRGVPNVDDALKELLLEPVQAPFHEIAHPGYIQYLLANRLTGTVHELPDSLLGEAESKMEKLLNGIEKLNGTVNNREEILEEVKARLKLVLSLSVLEERYPLPGGQVYPAAIKYILERLEAGKSRWITLLNWVFVHNLGKAGSLVDFEQLTLSWLDEWQLGKTINQECNQLGMDDENTWKVSTILRLMVNNQNWYQNFGKKPVSVILETWLSEEYIRNYLNINRYKDVLWFNKDAFEEFLWWMMLGAMLTTNLKREISASQLIENTLGAYEIVKQMLKAEEKSNYQLNRLLELVKSQSVDDL